MFIEYKKIRLRSRLLEPRYEIILDEIELAFIEVAFRKIFALSRDKYEPEKPRFSHEKRGFII